MKIAVIGTGYVGLVTGTCFAELGNNVICVDIDEEKIRKLNNNIIPIYEPGLEEMTKRNAKLKRLTFTTSIKEAVEKSDIIFIAVGTPPRPGGDADLSYVENVAKEIATHMKSHKIIIEKSTVPVETGEWIKKTVHIHNKNNVEFDIVSCPEFLKEGTAVNDFMSPDRIVVGCDSDNAKEIMSELFKPFKAPIVWTDIKSAELIKHASNAFLATKISFINAVSRICDLTGADVKQVAAGMGLDARINRSFLNAGIGYGGFCFPKDLEAFIAIAKKNGYDFTLLKAVKEINDAQKEYFIEKVEKTLWNLRGKTVGVLGLAFKPNTDDMRFAPAIEIIEKLQEEGVNIKAYDPVAMENAKKLLKDVHYCTDPYDAAKGADALLIITEWNEFKELDFHTLKKVMKRALIIDGRNIYEPDDLEKKGFTYICIGRGEHGKV